MEGTRGNQPRWRWRGRVRGGGGGGGASESLVWAWGCLMCDSVAANNKFTGNWNWDENRGSLGTWSFPKVSNNNWATLP